MSEHGFWLLVSGRELFVAFEHFPWFRNASIGQLFRVELQSPEHVYWPELDVDLHVDSIEHPERFPLVSRVREDAPRWRVARAPRAKRARLRR